ncbi:hypothetical protein FOZ62_028401 [Perkinsus olseni]|uniref:AB hydrolase-1 domain-containing protein n=1 Tax=Perkinsus olseni TaxID=32597 RepID=A0A7J6RU83_PEROL|nr:hypothetical protein FOZ62_028401 [Perkinsus olseni]
MPWVARPDGHLIYYRVVEPADASMMPGKGNIVMIMGLAMSHVCWAPQTAFLSSIGYKVLLIDNRGVGFSTPERFSMRPHTISSMARDALACIQECGMSEVHLVGVSMGGMISQRLALMVAEGYAALRIKSLVLITTHCRSSLSTMPSLAAMADLISIIATRGGGPLKDPATGEINGDHPMLRLLFPKKWRHENREEIVEAFARVDREELPPDVSSEHKKVPLTSPADALKQIIGLLNHSVGEDGIEKFHKTLRMPMLIIYGGKDKLVPPESSRRIARRAVPELTTVVELPESGHALMLQCEEELHAILEEHFRKIDDCLVADVSRL